MIASNGKMQKSQKACGYSKLSLINEDLEFKIGLKIAFFAVGLHMIFKNLQVIRAYTYRPYIFP
jgi:hypothetical protein